MSSKVILLYGSGPNVGASILKKFAGNGWKTVAVVRTMKDEYKDSADLVLQANFADAQAIQKVYDQVQRELGTPNCVVYNGWCTAQTVFENTANGAQPTPLNHSARTPPNHSLLRPRASRKILPSIQLAATQRPLLPPVDSLSCHQDPRYSYSPATASPRLSYRSSLVWEAEKRLRRTSSRRPPMR